MRVVEVDGFWIDRHPVTVAEFREFVSATGYRTVAERPPDPADFPGVDPAKLVPGSLVFHMTAGPVDLRDYFAWWDYVPDACWGRPEGPGSSVDGRERPSGGARRLRGRRRLRSLGRQAPAHRGGVGMRRPGRARRRCIHLGRGRRSGERAARQHVARRIPLAEPRARRLRGHVARRQLPPERLRALRHGGQCLGVDEGLLHGGRDSDAVLCARRARSQRARAA